MRRDVASAPAVRRRFPKSARLVRASEFDKLRREGRSYHGSHMVLSVHLHGNDEPARVGFITSRKVGNAATRNRVRRRLREIVRSERPRLRPGVWLVVVARARAAMASFDELRAEWLNLAERAALLERVA